MVTLQKKMSDLLQCGDLRTIAGRDNIVSLINTQEEFKS